MALLGLDGPSIPPDFLSAVSSPGEPVAAHRAALPALRPLFGFLFVLPQRLGSIYPLTGSSRTPARGSGANEP